LAYFGCLFYCLQLIIIPLIDLRIFITETNIAELLVTIFPTFAHNFFGAVKLVILDLWMKFRDVTAKGILTIYSKIEQHLLLLQQILTKQVPSIMLSPVSFEETASILVYNQFTVNGMR